MEVVSQLDKLEKFPRTVLTLGNFDGVHIGHQAILAEVMQRVGRLKGRGVVFTFNHHPLKVLASKKHPPLLTTTAEKLALFDQWHLDVAVCVPFTRELANYSAERFMSEIIYSRIQPGEIIVGHDYAFGKGRRGNIDLLKKLAPVYGYQVHVIKQVKLDHDIVSSTLIREQLKQGKVFQAKRMLGRPYSIYGKVVTGNKRGKQLGFPSATLCYPEKLLPAIGVYVVKVGLADEEFKGVVNIGYQPTYQQQELRIEAHILDFNRDIYGCLLRLDFIKKLRDEEAFSSPGQLQQQIKRDTITARKALDAELNG